MGNEAGYPGGQPNSRGGQQGDSINGRLQIIPATIRPSLFVNLLEFQFVLQSHLTRGQQALTVT